MRHIYKNILILISLLLLVLPMNSYGKGDRFDHDHFKYGSHPHVAFYHHRFFPHRYFTIRFGGIRYFYYDGFYYRGFGPDYILVAPPIGAIVTWIPDDFEPVVINGITYYTYDGIYYAKHGSGYQVVEEPVTITTNQTTPELKISGMMTNQTSSTESFTVNIPGPKGGYIPVLIKRAGKGFIGPQGEYYTQFPKVSQLKAMYGK